MFQIRSISILLLAILMIPGLPASAQQARRLPVRKAEAPQKTAPDPTLVSMEADVLVLVNAHRGKLGLAPMQSDADLSTLAREHSASMAAGKTAFGHGGFDGRTKAYTQKAGVFVGGFAENVAYGSSTAEAVMDQWLNSAGHKRNIEGNYNSLGIGIARASNGTMYFTQIFAHR